MGESREGGREAAGLPVIRAVTTLVELFNTGNRELGELRVQRTTTGTYSVDITEHGADEWETLFVTEGDRP